MTLIMKRELLLFLFFTIAANLLAESITIKQKGGNETILELSTNPVITFSGENMVVTSEVTTIIFPIDDIDSYVVGNAASGIQEKSDAPLFYDGHIVFKGVKNKACVFVYSLDGKEMGKFVPDGSDIIDINLTSLPKGVFVISTPNNKIKVINK
jgi:hypothetical protein